MASGKGHLFGGFVFLLLFIHIDSNYFYRPSTIDLILYLAIGMMFAVWPDVDIKSYGQKFFYIIFFMVDVFLIYSQEYKIAAYFGLIIILPILAKHRGWTHSTPAMFLVPAPLLLYPMYVTNTFDLSGFPFYSAALTGYFSHLLLDGKVKIF